MEQQAAHPDPILQRVIEVYAAARYGFDPGWLTTAGDDLAAVRADLRFTPMDRSAKDLAHVLVDQIMTREHERIREAVTVADEIAEAIAKTCGAEKPALASLAKAKRADAGTKIADIIAVVGDLARFYEFLRYARTSHRTEDRPTRDEVLRWSGPTPWRSQPA
jgi:hypothetical protein